MMKPTFLSGLLQDFWSDLSDLSNPDLFWQLLTLLLCIAVGSAIARLMRALISKQDVPATGVVRLGVDSFSRVLSPLLGLILIELARPILARYHHVNVLRLFTPLLASFVSIRAVFYILRRIFARNGQASSFLSLMEKVVSLAIWVGAALYISGLWPDLHEFLTDTTIPVGSHDIALLVILQGTLSVGTTLIIALWIGAVLEDRLMRVETIHSSMRVVMARMARAILILLAVLISLSLVGIDLTVLSVFGGALGVGLGLGLQKIASSYVSGFVILLERSLAIGDLVSVDKYYGIVTHINTRYTVLKGLDGIESVVPNDVLISNAIQNYSLTDTSLRLATTVTVAYHSELEETMRLMDEATASVPRVMKDPAPQTLFVKFGTNGLDLEVGFWIADPQNGRMGVTSDVNRAIWKVLQKRGIELPSPQRDIRILNPDEFKKNLTEVNSDVIKQT